MSASLLPRPTATADLGRLDRCRRPVPVWSPRRSAAVPAKEWHHVVVHHPRASLLLNLSESVDPDGRTVVRLVAMVHAGDDWYHEILTAGPGEASIDDVGVDVRIGHRARFHWSQGSYRLHVHGDHLRLDLELRPASDPQLLAGGILSPDERISWLIVPRLTATGRVDLPDGTVDLRDAPAYHDHNWGHFAWGGDFGWEWASATATDWSFTASRLLDRRRTAVSAQYLTIEDDVASATFRDGEITVEHVGRFDHRPTPVVPGVMRLVAPGPDEDVPRSMVWTAGRRDLHATVTVTPTALARLVIPSDERADEVVVLAELFADVRVDAQLGDRTVTSSGPGILELLR